MTSACRLAGKRVVVTGAAQGLGREFALHLAGLGASVLACDIRADGLAHTAELGRDQSAGAVIPTILDVSSAADCARLEGLAREALGGLDALVNNAAVVAGLERRPFEQIDEAEWDRVLAVNAKGPWLCTKSVVGALREAGGGSIVNLASEVAFSGSPGLAHYVTSKAAVIGLTRVLARELGADGIRVNSLAPGFISTPATVGLTGGVAYDTDATPLGRVGAPADLLGALTFLLADESAFVTGQTLLVNGGRVLN